MYNRSHKDRVFIKLFGSEEYKENLFELYNALNDTNYTDINDLELTTIDNVIYMGYKNDISFLISDEINLYEHMGTYNPNMPLRGMIYLTKQFEKYLAIKQINIHTSKQIKLPNPRYYIFYNGEKDTEDEVILRLSDAFIKKEIEGDVECVAHLLNINYGKNKKLFENCKTLKEYAILINTIREKVAERESREDAISEAVDECIEKGILKDFLYVHKVEVIGMLLTEFDEEKYVDALKKEYLEEGQQRGEQIGLERGKQIGLERGAENRKIKDLSIIKALKDGEPIEEIAKKFDVPIEDVKDIAEIIF